MARKESIVEEFMTRHPHTIGVDQTLDAANKMMRELEVRHLPVLKGGKVTGILSDRDVKLAFGFAPKEFKHSEWKVEDAYVDDPMIVSPKDPIEKVVRQMYERKVGSVLVLEKEKLVGIMTYIDIYKAFFSLVESNKMKT